MAKPLLASMEYSHNCICSDVPERYSDTHIKYLTELGEDKKKIAHMFNITGENIGRYLEAIRTHPTTINVRILRKQKNSADIVAVTKNDASTRFALNKTGCAFLSNPVYSGGIERINIFAPSFESFRRFIDSLENSYNVKITSKHYLKNDEKILPENLIRSGFLEFLSAAGRLTKKQMQTLKLASNMNYYDIPKGTSLSKIGERMGISDAAAGELLRKAEKKLLPAIAKIIELQN